MKKILKSNSLFILLLMVCTSCISGTLKKQLSNHDRLHQLTRRYSTTDSDCNMLQGDVYICSDQVSGLGVTTSDAAPGIIMCDYVAFLAKVMNMSKMNDTCLPHHYSGNLTATVAPYSTHNSNVFPRDTMTANDILTDIDVYNYTMNADLYLCTSEVYLNLTLCDNDSCIIYDPDGIYDVADSNSTCIHYTFAAIIHSVNKTDSYI